MQRIQAPNTADRNRNRRAARRAVRPAPAPARRPLFAALPAPPPVYDSSSDSESDMPGTDIRWTGPCAARAWLSQAIPRIQGMTPKHAETLQAFNRRQKLKFDELAQLDEEEREKFIGLMHPNVPHVPANYYQHFTRRSTTMRQRSMWRSHGRCTV